MDPVIIFLFIIFVIPAALVILSLKLDAAKEAINRHQNSVPPIPTHTNATIDYSMMIVDGQLNTSPVARIDSHGKLILPGQFSGWGN